MLTYLSIDWEHQFPSILASQNLLSMDLSTEGCLQYPEGHGCISFFIWMYVGRKSCTVCIKTSEKNTLFNSSSSVFYLYFISLSLSLCLFGFFSLEVVSQWTVIPQVRQIGTIITHHHNQRFIFEFWELNSGHPGLNYPKCHNYTILYNPAFDSSPSLPSHTSVKQDSNPCSQVDVATRHGPQQT